MNFFVCFLKTGILDIRPLRAEPKYEMNYMPICLLHYILTIFLNWGLGRQKMYSDELEDPSDVQY